VREWVVLELVRGDIEASRVGVFITLVCIKLMERLALIILCPSTIRTVYATIDPSRIGTNRRECTTLLQSAFANIHATRVAHTVGLTTTILWAETILHELLVRLGGDLAGNTSSVCTMETVNTGRWLVVVPVLLIVAIRLESRGILSECLGRNETLRTVVPETIST
jgi:hypothetical protein